MRIFDKEEAEYVPVLIRLPRALRYKLRCVAPIYDHTITSLANVLFEKFIEEHEAKGTPSKEMKSGSNENDMV